MRHVLFRFSVAIIAFIVGVLTATAFAALFGIGAVRERGRHYDYAPRPVKMRSCRSRLRDMPEPPPPPAPAPRQAEGVGRSAAGGSAQAGRTADGVETRTRVVVVERR